MSTDRVYPVRVAELSFLDVAKERYDNSVELDCTPADLFAIFADENSWPVWAPGFKRIDWTSPRPFGAGTTRTATLMFGLQIHEVFLAWEDGTRMAFTFTGSNQDMSGGLDALIEDYNVVSLGEGRCRLTWTLAYDAAGFMRHFQFLARPMVGFFLRRILGGLRRYVRRGTFTRALPAPVEPVAAEA
jgi:hypothetical protein